MIQSKILMFGAKCTRNKKKCKVQAMVRNSSRNSVIISDNADIIRIMLKQNLASRQRWRNTNKIPNSI